MEFLKEYNNPKFFWKETNLFLREEEAKNCLVLGLSYSFLEHPENCVYQSALFGSAKFHGVLVCSKYLGNNNLLISPTTSVETATQLFETFLNKGIKFNNIIGESKSAKIYQNLAEAKGFKTKILMQQGIYRCRKSIIPTKGKRLVFRLAEKGDTTVLVKWMDLFRKEAAPHDPPMDTTKVITEKIRGRMLYVLERKDELLSCAAWSRDIETSCSINFVFTPKELRKKGYASIVTARLTQLLLKNKKHETNLFTDIKNKTSNKIYQKIGYKFVCDSVHLKIISP